MGTHWSSVMTGPALNSASSKAPQAMTGSQTTVNGDRKKFYALGTESSFFYYTGIGRSNSVSIWEV